MEWLTITYYTLAGLIAIPTIPTITCILIQYRRTYRVPSDLPWAGLRDKWFFPKTRASIREFAAKRGPINEGYEQYGKHGKAFVLPAMHWPDVALPPSLNAWLIAQPDSVLSTLKAQDDLLMLDHLGHGPTTAAVHDFSVITRDLTRQMGRLLPDLMDELTTSFEKDFGTDDEEWKEVKLYETLELFSRRGANRMFLSLPLCRNDKLMKLLLSSGMTFAICGAILRTFVPSFLKGLLAPIIALPFFYQRWRIKRILLPTITQRMRALQDASQNEKSPSSAERPNDGLQWIISSAYNRTANTFALDPGNIAGKAMLLNFFAVFTTSITSGTALLDILEHKPNDPSSSCPADLIDQLRTEAAEILPKLKDDPTAVRQMYKLDSAIRETLRVNPMFGRGIQREVVQAGGVTTPDGLYLPQGTHVCALILPMQRDADRMDDADQYQPLRYYKGPPADGTCPISADKDSKQLSAVQISPDFLSFSLGKHSCPGRFFAVQTMKVMLGWLLLNYDFELIYPEGKKELEWLEVGEARLPPQGKGNTAKVKRRKLEADDDHGGSYRDNTPAGEKDESLV